MGGCKISDYKKGVIIGLVSASGFGALGYFGLLLNDLGFSIAQSLFIRFFGATLIIWPWLVWRRKWKIPLGTSIRGFAMGAVGYTVQSALYFITLTRLNSGLANVLLYLYPAFVTILDCSIYRRRPSPALVFCLLTMFLGCFMIVDSGSIQLDPVGVGAGICMALWYAVYLIVGEKYLVKASPFTLSGYLFLGCTCSFGIYVFVFDPFVNTLNLSMLYPSIGIVVVSTVIPIVAIFRSIQLIRAPLASAISTFEPVVAVSLGQLLLSEVLSLQQYIGMALIVVGILLIQRIK